MTVQTLEVGRSRMKLNLSRHRGLIAANLVFALLLAVVAAISPMKLGYYDIASLITSGARSPSRRSGRLSLSSLADSIFRRAPRFRWSTRS